MKNTFLSAIIALFIGVSANAQSTVDSITAKYKLLPMPAPLTVEKTFPVLGAYQLTTGAPGVTSTSSSATVAPSTTTATTSVTTTATDSNAAQTQASTPATTTTAPATDVAATEATPSVSVTLDSVNKGVIWVEGLPEGKFKAYLKKSPTTYRILAQKTNLGKQIPEGTLHYDVEANALHIALGKSYNEEDPTGIFAVNAPATTDVAATSTAKSKSSKSKSKVTFYTASKVITEPAVETEAQGGGTTTQDQQDQQ
jgi:hypothetical protein